MKRCGNLFFIIFLVFFFIYFAEAAPVISNLETKSSLDLNTTKESLFVNLTSSGSSTNIIDWRKNGISIMVLNMPFETNFTSTDNSTRGVRDYSSYNNNGSLGNSTEGTQPTFVSGRTGGAYFFDGVDDFIHLGTDESLRLQNKSMTIAFWFKTATGISDYKSIIFSSDIYGRGGYYIQSFSNSFYLRVNNETTGAYTGFSVNRVSIDNNTWVFATFSINRTGNQMSVSTYKNAIQIGNAQTVTVYGNFNGTSSLYTSLISSAGLTKNITFDQIMIFDRELSSKEIKALYNNRTDIISPQETLVGENWSSCATPSDMDSEGGILCSNNLTILSGNINTYYVRPYSGGYNLMDGVSYENAWDGFSNIFWQYISPGDTLYLCGGFNESLTVNINGNSTDNFVIRGDCTNGSSYIDLSREVTGWSGPDAEGVYSKITSGYFLIENEILLPKASNSSLNDGNWYYNSSTFFYKPTNNTPSENIIKISQSWGGIYLDNKSYVNVTAINVSRAVTGISAIESNSGGQTSNSLSVQNSHFYQCGMGFYSSQSDISSNISILNNTFEKTGRSVSLYTKGDTGRNISSCRIERNIFSDGGSIDGYNSWDSTNAPDLEAIGLQNPNDCIIKENNIIGGTNIGIILYGEANSTTTNNLIANNFISNITNYAIGIHGHYLASDYANNTIIYNIMANTGNQSGSVNYSISLSNVASASGINNSFTNNVIYNSFTGIRTVGKYWEIKNNLLFNSSYYSLYSTNFSGVFIDYNSYYSGNSLFNSNGNEYNFSSWQIVYLQDTNSIVSEVFFSNTSGFMNQSADFQLLWNSHAIDSGVNLGLTTDFSGNPIYGIPDIGVYEYQPPYNISTDAINMSISKNIRIYGDGKYRHISSDTTDSGIANLNVHPVSGYNPLNYSQLLDINISSWSSSSMNWIESSDIHELNTTHTICGLISQDEYDIYYTKNSTRTKVSRSAANSNGCLSFDYRGGYSTVSFEVSRYFSASSPSSGYPSYNLPQEELKEGIEKSLGENWKIKFSIQGENHELKINKIENGSVTLTISSEPFTVTIFVGDENKYDLNSDGYYDLYLKLNLIRDNKADLLIKEINEEISETEGNLNIPFSGMNKWKSLGIALIAVILLFSILRYFKSKKG